MQKTKGTVNYIKSRRKSQCIKSILMFGVCFCILGLGLVLNKNSKANLFTVFAILGVLPSVKILISYIILLPYTSVPVKVYEQVRKQVPDGVLLYTDVVFTSEEKSMMLDFVAIDRHFLVGYREPRSKKDGYVNKFKYKEEMESIKKYLKDGFKIRGINYQVELYEDLDQYLNRIGKLSLSKEEMTGEYKEVQEYFWSLMV